MAAQSNGQLFARNAAAVVFHHDQPDAARQKAHVDLQGSCVQGVVDQLAHHGGGALNHLTRGDLADQLVGEVAYGAAGRGGG